MEYGIRSTELPGVEFLCLPRGGRSALQERDPAWDVTARWALRYRYLLTLLRSSVTSAIVLPLLATNQ